MNYLVLESVAPVRPDVVLLALSDQTQFIFMCIYIFVPQQMKLLCIYQLIFSQRLDDKEGNVLDLILCLYFYIFLQMFIVPLNILKIEDMNIYVNIKKVSAL